jgi:hypothetical protein
MKTEEWIDLEKSLDFELVNPKCIIRSYRLPQTQNYPNINS